MTSTKAKSVAGENRIEDAELRWLRITAGIVSLIGLISLFALMTESAHAEGGFSPGNRPFPTSPFANTPQPGGGATARPQNFFNDEEGDDFGGAQGQPAAGGAANPKSPAGGTGPISMGGTPNNGVVSPRQPKPIPLDAETGAGGNELVTDFNFPDADILDIAKTLGKLTGKNFIFDKDVKGRISIISNSPITVGDAWKAFLTALDMNQFAIIPSGKYLRIARQRDARDKQLKTYTGEYSPDSDALITRVFPLKYIDAEEVARTFRSFMPANARIIPYEQTNTVIVTDTGANIAKLAKMLEILDVEGYDVGIEVIPVKYASAAELSKLIDQLIPGTGGAGPGGAPHFGVGGGGGRFNARRTKEGGIINTIIADERTNNLIVHANGKGAEQVRQLVAKLDQKQPAQTGGGKVHVIYLQFADAEQLANTLNSLTQGAGPGGFRPPTPGGTGTGVNPVSSALFEGSIKISPDKSTNALVVNASPSDFVTIQRVINRLDIPRDEVFVEVIIMEIALDKTFDFSSNIASPSNSVFLTPNQDLLQFVQNPLASTGAVIPFPAGKQTTVTVGNVTYPVSSVIGLVKAIQSNSRSNILATPQIIALDNAEANFEQTEKIPIPNTTLTATGLSQASITYESVTLSIKIKPQINKLSNFVKLDIESKLGNLETRALPAAVQNQAYATLERNAKTTVVVGDSDTVVIGGLIRDNYNDTVSKIPLLGDIPILGWLFSARHKEDIRSDLVIFMTPHIVRQYDRVRAILDHKLKERDDMIERDFGGDDPYRYERDQIIRSLPDVKELMNKKPQTTVTIDEEQTPPEQSANAPNNPFSGTEAPPVPATPPAPPATAPEGNP